jgi:hypothetical protein
MISFAFLINAPRLSALVRERRTDAAEVEEMDALFFKKKLLFFHTPPFFRTQACDFVGELRAKGIA